MIHFKNDNLFSYINKVDAIINTVNIVGVMGKGIALEFKKRYPENYSQYKYLCTNKLIDIGNSFVYEIENDTNNTKYIINFPTKKHWRNSSKIEYIEKGLDNLIDIIKKYNIKSLALPALGCGNGNLDWKKVKPLIISKLSELDYVNIIVIEPSSYKDIVTPKPRLTLSRKRLLALMDYYNLKTSNSLITHIEVNLISYLLNHTNSKTKFELTRNGPFNKEISKLLLTFNKHYITILPSNNQDNGTQLKVISNKVFTKKEMYTDDEFIRVKNLIEDFTDYNDLLILSMAHWFKFNADFTSNSANIPIESFKNWLNENNQIYSDNIIIKAFNRIEKIYLQSENLTFKL